MRPRRGSRPAGARSPYDPVGLLALPALAGAFHLATAEGYGYFRDELYYLACAERLAWGYVDHPPLIAWLTAALRSTAGASLVALRSLSALAAAATVAVAALTARELGGGRFAQTTAALATALAPIYLSLFSILSMNAFDVLFWAIGWWLAARILRRGDDRLWMVFGALMGIALLNKISVLFLGFGLAVGLVAARRWEVLRSRWLWAGGAIALLLLSPYLLWQAAHGWPTLEFMANAREEKIAAISPAAFLALQGLLAGPAALPVCLGGLALLLAGRPACPWRPLGWAFVAILALMLTLGSKPYYVAPAYTLLYAAGGVALAAWISRRPGRFRLPLRAALLVMLAAGGVLLAPLAKPLLPVPRYLAWAERLGLQPATDERHELGELPQFFADMHGWPELAATVGWIFHSLPPEDQARACVFGQNYGQTGAIEFFGRAQGLPAAISGHNSYYLWGPRGCTGDVVIVIGDHRERLEELFAEVEQAVVFTCRYCMPYEDDKPIWVARGLRRPVAELWPEVKRYI